MPNDALHSRVFAIWRDTPLALAIARLHRPGPSHRPTLLIRIPSLRAGVSPIDRGHPFLAAPERTRPKNDEVFP
jgi:hypothetical protein